MCTIVEKRCIKRGAKPIIFCILFGYTLHSSICIHTHQHCIVFTGNVSEMNREKTVEHWNHTEMCSSNFVYWSISSTFAALVLRVIFLFVRNWYILKLNCDFTARFIHENHTHVWTERKSRWWSSYWFAWETSFWARQLPTHSMSVYALCVSVVVLFDDDAAVFLQLFVTVFHFKSDVNYWSCIDSWVHLLRPRAGYVFPGFEKHCNPFALKRLFCCYSLNWMQTHTRTHKIGISNT